MSSQMHKKRRNRARIISEYPDINDAFLSPKIKGFFDVTLSEAIVLGLVRQQVRIFIGIFGHGSTDLAEVLRVYEEEGVVKMYAVRHETEAVHAATALRWVTGEKSAVVTSIGPGALHALAGSLAPLSNGLGIWLLLGDETTHDEGPNMQQIPGHEQNRFHRLFSAMGNTYTLHTPEAIGSAMRKGLVTTEHPFRQQPFFLLMPMNTQPQVIKRFNPDELPNNTSIRVGAADVLEDYQKAVDAIRQSKKMVVKVGGGARHIQSGLLEFLDLSDGVAVNSPLVPGVVPFSHERNMTVGGSKGSISGNYAMEEADMLVAIGTRFVCQSDCSRTGYPKVKKVLNINSDINSAFHYSKTIALLGDIETTLLRLNEELKKKGVKPGRRPSAWLKACMEKRREWDTFRNERYRAKTLFDGRWKRKVLTQPVVIKTASDWAIKNKIISFFDAGDVQANGFQIVEPEKYGSVYNETGASYMGFAVSALLATAMSDT
ncbi:MAG: thiamine pyrophosphate-binding protein, partial [Deltaproteobacteria bacterium]|nr:thiamine pyrophosphate-binding protein [Deltaproteobacteria bacterium]